MKKYLGGAGGRINILISEELKESKLRVLKGY